MLDSQHHFQEFQKKLDEERRDLPRIEAELRPALHELDRAKAELKKHQDRVSRLQSQRDQHLARMQQYERESEALQKKLKGELDDAKRKKL